MEAGTDRLLIDKTRPSRIPPLDEAVTERVVALTERYGRRSWCRCAGGVPVLTGVEPR